MAWRVCSDAEPTCGNSTALGSVEQRLRHVRLVGEDVEAGGSDGAVGKRLRQRLLVDRAAAADIDEDAVRAERRQHCRH